MQFEDNTLTTIPHLLYLIKTQSASDSLSALHLKHMHQTPNCMNILLETLQTIDPKKLIIFDVKVDAAKYLYSHNKQLQIAASVAHPYDIKRYNNAVGGTLMTIEDLIANKNIFTWAWLDEWDLTDKDNGIKSLYNKETFNRLRDQQIKIALVTPELHATSPGLVGNEAHQDAQNQERLSARFTRIINLQPDAICTDHPDYIYSLINRRTNCK